MSSPEDDIRFMRTVLRRPIMPPDLGERDDDLLKMLQRGVSVNFVPNHNSIEVRGTFERKGQLHNVFYFGITFDEAWFGFVKRLRSLERSLGCNRNLFKVVK